jgi:hypothetical protein
MNYYLDSKECYVDPNVQVNPNIQSYNMIEDGYNHSLLYNPLITILEGQNNLMQNLVYNQGYNNTSNQCSKYMDNLDSVNNNYVSNQDNVDMIDKAYESMIEHKCLTFPSTLKEGSLQNCHMLTEDQICNWIMLKELYNESYDSQQQQDLFASHFTNRSQNYNETVVQYANILRQLGRAAYGNFTLKEVECVIKSIFLLGILPEIKECLIQQISNSVNLDEIIMRASKIEKEIQTRCISDNILKPPSYMITDISKKQPQEVKQVISSYDRQEDPQPLVPKDIDNKKKAKRNIGVKSKICFSCKRPGHTIRHCSVICHNCNQRGHTKYDCSRPFMIQVDNGLSYTDNFYYLESQRKLYDNNYITQSDMDNYNLPFTITKTSKKTKRAEKRNKIKKVKLFNQGEDNYSKENIDYKVLKLIEKLNLSNPQIRYF